MIDAQPNKTWRPGLADVLFLLVALAVFRGSRHTLLDDPGLGWHLRNVDAMLAHGGWLTHDPFTYTADEPPARWYTNQWIGELPYWIGWKWAGLEGIAMANAIVFAVLAGLIYRVLIREGHVWPSAMIWSSLAMMGTSCSWNARPNTFSILFLYLTVRACLRLREDRLSQLQAIATIVLFAIWANTHGGFVAGLVTLGAATFFEMVSGFVFADEQARLRWIRFACLSVGCGLATLFNPYGIGLYEWVFQLLGDPFFMELHQEWRSPNFHSPGAMRYELWILLVPLFLGLSNRRPHLVELGLSILWLHFALTGFRYVALWVVVTVHLIARSSLHVEALNTLANRIGLNAAKGSLFYTPHQRITWVWTIVLAVLAMLSSHVIQGKFAQHKQEIIASVALDELIQRAKSWKVEHERMPVILHDYKWGGYVTWHGWPDLLNWIDDRNEVQGKVKIEQYFDLMAARPGWRSVLDRVDFACLDPSTSLANELRHDPGWRCEEYPRALLCERIRRPE